MAASCFECGSEGHFARDCPNMNRIEAVTDNRPPWCGSCSARTRLVNLSDGRQARCPVCHPLADQELPQHARCGGCGQAVHAWNPAGCDRHKLIRAS